MRHSPPLLAILLRALLFTGFASAVWALLAVVARQDLQAGVMAYGVQRSAAFGKVNFGGATPVTR